GDAKALLKGLQPESEKLEYGGQAYTRAAGGPGRFCFLADERTVVASAREEHLRRFIVAGKSGASKAKWAGAWTAADDADAAAIINTAALGELMNQVVAGGPPVGTVTAIAPLWLYTSHTLLQA